ncbi:MAG: glycosyltransferase family 39 protein, partial [Verrucomicrobia bacterium]|nr:glycosyltransferase family 39 protein [Verrucomicrobiota bacterium]
MGLMTSGSSMKTTCASCASSETLASGWDRLGQAGLGWVCLLIGAVWLLTRAYPLSQTVPWTTWEVWEAKKLLEYGFVERQGAILNPHFMTGRLPDPAKYNYVNHPYPILWLDALAYGLGGQWACLLLNSAIQLAGCLMVFAALRRVFEPGASVVGALLYTLAPVSVTLDPNTSTVVVGAVAWPFLVWLLGRGLQQERFSAAVWLGVAMFLAGQISWLVYTLVPPLALAAAGFVPGL